MIESAQYIADSSNNVVGIQVVCDGITSVVPITGGNWMLALVQAWVAAGNVITPAATVQTN